MQPWYKRVWQDEQNYLPTTPVDYTKLRCVACSAVLPLLRVRGSAREGGGHGLAYAVSPFERVPRHSAESPRVLHPSALSPYIAP